MSGILILGAGGHAKVIADILLRQRMPVRGFLDDDPMMWRTTQLGMRVLGAIDDYERFAPDGLVMGIGNNIARQAVVQRLGARAKHLWCNAIHPAATIAESVRMGCGAVIAARAVVNPDTIVGDHVIINTGATVDHDCNIGNYSHVAPGSHLAGGVTVGEGTLIGIGSSVIPYRVIGRWATIGAGTVVIDGIPDGVIAKGNPARWDEIAKS